MSADKEDGERKEGTLAEVLFLQLALPEIFGQLMVISSIVEVGLRELPQEQISRILDAAEVRRADRFQKMNTDEATRSEDYDKGLKAIGEAGAAYLAKLRERLSGTGEESGESETPRT